MKDSLRKKGQQPTDSVKGSPQQAPKRKRGLSDSDAPDLSSPTTRASKRARNMKPDSGNNPVPSELTGSQVLRPRRTAATRATKRYRGRKNKSSSPAPSGSPGVDFDEIPGDSASMQPSEQAMALPEDPKPVARIGRQPRKTRTTAKARKEIPADLGVKAEPPKVEKRGRKPKLLRPPPTELNGQKPPSDSDLPTQDESMQDELLSPPSQEGWCLDLKPDTVGTVADLVRGDSQKDAGVDIKVIATTKQLPPGETQISHSTNKERSVKKSNKAPWLNIPAKSTPRDVRQDSRRSSMTHRSELNLTPRPTPMPIPVPKAPMPTNDRPLKPPVLVVGSSKRSLPLLEVVTTGQSKPAVDSREVLHIASANATNITQQSKMTPPEEVRDSDYSTHTLTIEDRNKPTEPETIDLTQDTPPKQLPPAKEKKTTISPPAAMSTISAKPDLKPLPETPRVVFKQPLFPPPDRRETSHLQKMPQALRMPGPSDI